MSRITQTEGVVDETQMDNQPVVNKSYSYSYSTSTKTRTTMSDSGEPQTVSETSTHTSTDGDPKLASAIPHDDGFEELKRSILSGDAYKRKMEEISAKPGFTHFEPQAGSTVTRPVNANNVQSSTVNSSSATITTNDRAAPPQFKPPTIGAPGMTAIRQRI